MKTGTIITVIRVRKTNPRMINGVLSWDYDPEYIDVTYHLPTDEAVIRHIREFPLGTITKITNFQYETLWHKIKKLFT